MPQIFKIYASTAFERPAKMKDAAQAVKDIRKPNRPCNVCGVETLIGIRENSPLKARERWNGTAYVRFCGVECEVAK